MVKKIQFLASGPKESYFSECLRPIPLFPVSTIKLYKYHSKIIQFRLGLSENLKRVTSKAKQFDYASYTIARVLLEKSRKHPAEILRITV